MSNAWFQSQAREDFQRARRKSFLQSVAALLSNQPNELIPFDEVRKRINIRGMVSRGLQHVPLDKIIGSEGRYTDFDRRFLPRRTQTSGRWQSVDLAHYAEIPLPPVDLYKLGDVYFVKDGNHRVSVARERGNHEIDAYVTEYMVDVPLDERLSLRDLLLKEEYSDFLEWTGLADLRPEQRIELSALGGYLELIEHINTHRYYLSTEQERDVLLEEAVASWYDTVYMPAIEAIRQHKILAQFPGRTEADLYVWIMQHRRSLLDESGVDPGAEVATLSLASQYGRRSVLDTVGDTAHRLASSALTALVPPRDSPPLELLDFVEWAKIDQLCPDADVRLSEGQHYGRLRDHILDHRFFLSLDRGEQVTLDEAIEHWCSEYYMPVLRAVHEQDVLRHFPGRTETDLYLWIMDHLHYRRQANEEIDIPTAAAQYTAEFGNADNVGTAVRSLLDGVGRVLGVRN